MARGRQKQLDRMDKMEALEQKEIKPHFRFDAVPLTTTEHLKVKHLNVGYHYPVLSDVNFSIKGGEKVVITGSNGIGKSTLLKTLISQIRIYGRLLEMCVPVCFTGGDFRKITAQQKMERLKKLME